VVAYQADPWAALGDPTRRAVFERLAERPRAVGELAGELPVSRPAVSQHLKILKDAGLVIDEYDDGAEFVEVTRDWAGTNMSEALAVRVGPEQGRVRLHQDVRLRLLRAR